MSRRGARMTRMAASEKVAHSLREFGYPDVTAHIVKECLDAWLEGKRDGKLPHGVIGMFASRQFDEVEDAKPGWLAELVNA